MRVVSARINGDTQIHLEGCSHLNRRGTYEKFPADEAADRLAVAEMEYGRTAGGFYEEGGGEEGYGSYHDFLVLVATDWVHFAPCCKALPLEAK